MFEARSTIVFYIIITTLFVFLLIAFMVFIVYLFQRRYISHQQKIKHLKSEFEKTLLFTQLEIQEETFQNISSEIHDNIGLSLTLAKLNLNTIDWQRPVQTKEKVFSSVDLISKAIEDLSYISKTLHTDYIEENGLLNALDLEMKKIEKLKLYSISYEVTGDPVYMKTQKELVIFRIIQEVLNNSIKHAQATMLKVLLDYTTDHVKIELADNGKGFRKENNNPESLKGTGLLNIIKRASIIEGSCEITSEPGQGTTVIMQIPY